MAYWSAQGISSDEMALLKNASVQISDLGGSALGYTEDGHISIDDDAAGHGWSLGIGGVARDKVDLFSVLVHEMGHVLGHSDDDMGAMIAVGERELPAGPVGDDDLPLPAALLGMVGVTNAAEAHPFG